VCSLTLLLACPATALAQPSTGPEEDRAADHPGLADLGSALRQDFVQTVSAGNLVLLGLGGSGALTAHSLDRRVAGTDWGDDGFCEPGDRVGSAIVQSAGAGLTYLVGRLADAPAVSHLGADLIRAQILSQTLTQGIKFTTT